MYRLVSLLVAGAVAAAAFTVYAQQPADPGDDPPLLKKKGAPDAGEPHVPPAGDKDKDKDKDKKPDEAPKPDADKGGAPEQPPRPDADEVLKGVAKSMHTAEERLANKQLGDPTRQALEDALKGLDSLIDLAENPPDDQDSKDDMNKSSSSSDSSKSGSDASKPSSGQSNSGSKSASPGSSGSPSSGSSASSSGRTGKGRRGSKSSRRSKGGSQPGGGASSSGQQQPGSQGDQPQDMAGAQGGENGKNGNGNGGGGKDAQNPPDKNADLYKSVWGHLPETLRAEMNAYSNTKGFMPEYESLISRYYSTIAEQGRRKGD